MSGLPPPGIHQVVTTFMVAKLITVIEPLAALANLIRLG